MALIEALLARSIGALNTQSFENSVTQTRPDCLKRCRTAGRLGQLLGGVSAVAVDAVEHRVLAGDSRGNVALYDLEGVPRAGDAVDPHRGSARARPVGCRLHTTTRASGHRGLVASVAWFPVDTGLFITTGLDCRLLVYDTSRFEVAEELTWREKMFCAAPAPASSKHSLVVVGSADPRIRLYDLASGAHAHTLVGHRNSVLAACWKDDFTVCTASVDRTVRVWDIRKSGEAACVASLNSYTGGAGAGAGAGRRLPVGTAHMGAVTSVHIVDGSGGRVLVTSGADSTIRMWNLDDYTCQYTAFEGVVNAQSKGVGLASLATGPHSAVLFHPNADGDIVAYQSTGEELFRLRGHYSGVNACAARLSTQQLVSGGDDGCVLVWTPQFPRLVPLLPRVAGDDAEYATSD